MSDNAPQTGYNLLVCAYALGDREGMKDAFLRLLTVGGSSPELQHGHRRDAIMHGCSDHRKICMMDIGWELLGKQW
jgi:hypothetical protein